jgi:hypothetical protein
MSTVSTSGPPKTDSLELFFQSLPPEFAEWRLANRYPEELRENHRRLQRRAFDLLATCGSRVAALPSSMVSELHFRGHNEPLDVLETGEIALRAVDPRCQPCPFCPPFSLPLDTINPEP